mgnify:CR=1 FL=1
MKTTERSVYLLIIAVLVAVAAYAIAQGQEPDGSYIDRMFDEERPSLSPVQAISIQFVDYSPVGDHPRPDASALVRMIAASGYAMSGPDGPSWQCPRGQPGIARLTKSLELGLTKRHVIVEYDEKCEVGVITLRVLPGFML